MNFLFADSDWEVEILDNPSPGFVGFDWKLDSNLSLIDNYGTFQIPKLTNTKLSPLKLLDNGLWVSLFLGKYYLLNQDFNLVDSIPEPENYSIDFHDIILLANGHYLIICVDNKAVDMSQIIDGGRTDAILKYNALIETDVNGNIFWEWKAIDHFEVTDYPINDDLKNKVIDFTHANSIFEDSDGNILISSRSLDEVTKIEKSSGNILWRLGGKMCKQNQFTFVNDTIDGFYGFSHQHSISVLPNGNLLLYDNGNLKPNQYTRAVEYKLDLASKTATKVWEYRPNPDVYLGSMGSVKRLPNGNTCLNFSSLSIDNPPLIVLELKPDNSIAFKLNYKGTKKPLFLYASRYITLMDAVLMLMNNPGLYDFNDSKNTTGIKVQVDNISGGGFASFEKYNYPPPRADFIDSNFASVLPVRWVFNQQNISSISGTMRINKASVSGLDEPNLVSIYYRENETKGKFKPLNTNYDPLTGIISAPINSFGEFILVSLKLSAPILVSPFDNQTNLPTNVNFKWNKLSGTTNYNFQLSTASDMNSINLDTILDADLNNFNYGKLKINTKYFWRIRGFGLKDSSSWSNIFEFSTSDKELPTPELISPLNNYIGFDNQDTLEWETSLQIDSYIVQISVEPDFISENVFENEINSNYYIPSGLENFKNYYWRVKSIENEKVSEWSEIRLFTTKIATPYLLIPINNQFNLEIEDTLSWQSVAGSIGYQLQISEFDNFDVIIVSTNEFSNKYHYSDFDYGKQYFWKVRAINNSDTSNWSEIRSFTTLLAQPHLVYPTNEQKGIGMSDYLEWTSIYSNTIFDVQVADNPEFTNPLIDSNKISPNTMLLNTLEYNIKYYWRVRASAAPMISHWSDIRYFTSELERPKILSPTKNAQDIDPVTKFKWLDENEYKSYRIQVSEDITFSENTIDSIIINKYDLTYHLNVSTTYYFRIKSETIDNYSSWSEVIKFTTSSTSDVPQKGTLSSTVHPNPASDFITISLRNKGYQPFATEDKVKIFDMLGIEIKDLTPIPLLTGEGLRIDVSHLPAGVYFIHISGSNGARSIVEKFVKM